MINKRKIADENSIHTSLHDFSSVAVGISAIHLWIFLSFPNPRINEYLRKTENNWQIENGIIMS